MDKDNTIKNLLEALQQIIDANPEPTLPHTTKIRDIALSAINEHKNNLACVPKKL